MKRILKNECSLCFYEETKVIEDYETIDLLNEYSKANIDYKLSCIEYNKYTICKNCAKEYKDAIEAIKKMHLPINLFNANYISLLQKILIDEKINKDTIMEKILEYNIFFHSRLEILYKLYKDNFDEYFDFELWEEINNHYGHIESINKDIFIGAKCIEDVHKITTEHTYDSLINPNDNNLYVIKVANDNNNSINDNKSIVINVLKGNIINDHIVCNLEEAKNSLMGAIVFDRIHNKNFKVIDIKKITKFGYLGLPLNFSDSSLYLNLETFEIENYLDEVLYAYDKQNNRFNPYNGCC